MEDQFSTSSVEQLRLLITDYIFCGFPAFLTCSTTLLGGGIFQTVKLCIVECNALFPVVVDKMITLQQNGVATFWSSQCQLIKCHYLSARLQYPTTSLLSYTECTHLSHNVTPITSCHTCDISSSLH